MVKIIIAVGIISFTFFRSASQDLIPAKYCSAGVFYDQDYTLEQLGLNKLNEDRNYTMGLGLYYASSSMCTWNIYKPHQWLLHRLNKKRENHVKGFYNLMLGNGSFTPDSLPADYPVLNDRPYASLTYLQGNAGYLDVQRYRLYNYSISLGILGSHISKEVQTFIHKQSNDNDTHDPRTPRGWGLQISEGGAPTILLGYQQDYLLTIRPLERRESGDLKKARRFGGEWKASWKANIGWYNMVAGELSYRFGWIDPKGWTYLNNPLGTSNMIAKGTGPPMRRLPEENYYDQPKKAEIYFFGTVRTNFIAYNVLLSGQGGKDPVSVPNRNVRRGVIDGVGGICISPVVCQRVTFDLKGKFNFRSPEFQAPGRKPRWHYWGGIDLIVTVLHKQ